MVNFPKSGGEPSLQQQMHIGGNNPEHYEYDPLFNLGVKFELLGISKEDAKGCVQDKIAAVDFCYRKAIEACSSGSSQQIHNKMWTLVSELQHLLPTQPQGEPDAALMKDLLLAWSAEKVQGYDGEDTAEFFADALVLTRNAYGMSERSHDLGLSRLVLATINMLHARKDDDVDGKMLGPLIETLVGKDGIAQFPGIKSGNNCRRQVKELACTLVDRHYINVASSQLSVDTKTEIAKSVGSIHHANDYTNAIHNLKHEAKGFAQHDEWATYELQHVAQAMAVAQLPDNIADFLKALLAKQHQSDNIFESSLGLLNDMSSGDSIVASRLRTINRAANADCDRIALGLADEIIDSMCALSTATDIVYEDDMVTIPATQQSVDKLSYLKLLVSKNDSSYNELLAKVSAKLEAKIDWDNTKAGIGLSHELLGLLNYFGKPPQTEIVAKMLREAVATERAVIVSNLQGMLTEDISNCRKFIRRTVALHYDCHVRLDNIPEEIRVEYGLTEKNLINEAIRKSSKESVRDTQKYFSSGYKLSSAILSKIGGNCSSPMPAALLRTIDIWSRGLGTSRFSISRPSKEEIAAAEKTILDVLGLQYSPQFDYYYQHRKSLPIPLISSLQSTFLPLTSNDHPEEITVHGKTYHIPRGMLADIRRAEFYVGNEKIPSEVAGKSALAADRELVELFIEKLTNLDLSDEEIVVICATMHQSSAAIMLDAAWVAAPAMFPAQYGVGILGSADRGVEYRLDKVPESGETLLDIRTSGTVHAFIKQGVNARDLDPLADLATFQQSFKMVPLGMVRDDCEDLCESLEKLEVTSSMRVKINTDGTVTVLNVKYEIPDITPELVSQVCEFAPTI